MKKTLFLLLTLGVGSLSAQTLIPRVGYVLSNSSFEPETYSESGETKSNSGFTFGVGYEFTLTEAITLQPELDFTRKGFKRTDKYSGDGYIFKDESTYTLNYLELPVLVRFRFGGDTKFYINAGPSVGMGLGGKYEIKSYAGSVLSYKDKGDIKFGDEPQGYEGSNQYADNKYEVGFQVGGGVLIMRKIMIDIRYGQSFTDIISDFSSKNKALQFSVGVPLNLF